MDLHDQTLADLTRISRDLDRCKSRQDINAVQDSMHSCIQDLREIIDMSIPSLLELFGFQHAVRTHLERAIGGDETIEIDVQDHSNGMIDQLPQTKRIALFRIAQEAINNAVRHAKAKAITVEVACKDGLHLRVGDNGTAPTTLSSIQTTGGLTHMRTRARLIGAQFAINQTGGTEIAVSLPVSECSDAGVLA